MNFYCQEKGFTLFELMVSIFVLMIITSMAIPSFHNLREKQEVKNLFPMLHQHVNLAKNHAVIYRQDIVMCASENLTSCQTNQWNQGVLIFFDSNQNKIRDENEEIISATSFAIKYGELKWKGNAANPNHLTFKGNTGLPRGAMGGFHYCNFKNLEYNKYLPIGMMGHLREEAKSDC